MVRSVEFFVTFFSLADRAAFERKKKDVNKLPTPRGPQEIKHFGGKASISITNDKANLGKNIWTFGPLCQALHEKIIKADEETVKIMRLLSEALIREVELYKDLSLAYASIEVFPFVSMILEQRNDRYV